MYYHVSFRHRVYFKFISLLFYSFSYGFSLITSLNFNPTSNLEFFFGTIIAALIFSIIESCFSFISYRCTNFLKVISSASKYEEDCIYWIIRSILTLSLCIFSFTPICPLVMTPIVHFIYSQARLLYFEACNYFFNAVQDSIFKNQSIFTDYKPSIFTDSNSSIYVYRTH